MRRLLVQIVVAILIIIAFAAGQFGLFASWGMAQPAAVALSILLIAAILWISEAIPLFVTSFVILVLCLLWLTKELKITGVEVSSSAFTSPFFSQIILLFLGGFVISSVMHKHHLDEQAARWIIHRTGNSIPTLIAGLMAVTAILSMFLSNTATTAMMIALCLPILQGLPAGDKYRKAILLAIPFAANIGGLGTPIGTPPNAIAIQYMENIGQAPGFAKWMLMAIPLVVIMLVILWALLMWFYRGNTHSISIPKATGTPDRLTLDRVVIILVILLTVVGWMTEDLHHYDLGTISLIPLIVFFGLKMLDIKDLRSLSWDVLLIMGGGLCLGVAMSRSGLATWFVSQLPSGTLSLITLTLALGVAACAMSTLMSHTAASNLIMPIVVGLAADGNSGLAADGVGSILMTVAFSCSLAMALPISTPPNAIAFSSGELAVKDMLKTGLLVTTIGLILTFTFGLWWWGVVAAF